MEANYIVIMIIFILLFMQRQKKKIWSINHIRRKKKKESKEMLELAKQFIGKECIIYTLNNQIEGVIKEISGNALMLEKNGMTEAVNLDFVIRIREYPRNKKGKKKAVVLD